MCSNLYAWLLKPHVLQLPSSTLACKFLWLDDVLVCVHSLCSSLCRFIDQLVYKVLEDMLKGVEGEDDPTQYSNMFLQWLSPQADKAGDPDETYCIIEGLLTVHYADRTSPSDGSKLWQRSDVDGVGSMKVIRVTDVKTGGKDFLAMLNTFLTATARPGSGPAWTGMASSSSHHAGSHSSSKGHFSSPNQWSLFAVIKDFSQEEVSNSMSKNVPAWFLKRRLCSSHPALKDTSEVNTSVSCALSILCTPAILGLEVDCTIICFLTWFTGASCAMECNCAVALLAAPLPLLL